MMLCVISYWVLSGAKRRQIQQLRCCVLPAKMLKRRLEKSFIHEVHTLLKTAFSYAVEWDLIHKIPLPRDAPKVNIEERTI